MKIHKCINNVHQGGCSSSLSSSSDWEAEHSDGREEGEVIVQIQHMFYILTVIKIEIVLDIETKKRERENCMQCIYII